MSSVSRFIIYLYLWMYSSYIAWEIEWNYSGTRLAFCLILKPVKSLFFLLVLIHFHLLYHSLSFAVTRWHLLSITPCQSPSLIFIHCHSFSFVVTHCTTRCPIRCTTRCHSLSLIVICCHSRQPLPFVCTTYHSSVFL